MPKMIRKIYEHNVRICKKYNINLVLINDDNVYNYIVPHKRFKHLAYNFKSDIVRYYILDKYGGFWFDTDVIIIKDINKIQINNIECMLDVEYDINIGCASLYIKKESKCSKYCIDYINNILDTRINLDWGDIGPITVEKLYILHKNLIKLNNYENVKKGANFICWNENPGHNKKNWYYENKNIAQKKAMELENNQECYYLITWTIYRDNNIEGDVSDFVLNNKSSVFSYFINDCEKKYAVMWASTINIGDDIQTLAGINFLKKKGITEYTFIDREKLSDYNGEPVILIMNGWYMHNISKFPPSDKITPIFISMFVGNEQLIKNNIVYFKKYEPIGCRDESTVKLFNKNGIKAYFTGCLTLLFDDTTEKIDKKYIVDVNTECDYIPNVNLNLEKFSEYTIIKHDIPQLTPLHFRLKMAELLLEKYKKAEIVITSRLHCILPCRAFNTNAIFIHKNYKSDPRFSGLKNIINGDSILTNNINIDRNELETIRQKFMQINL